MFELISTKENLGELLRYCVIFYDRKRFPDFKAVYQFVFTDKEETHYFYLSVGDGKAEYKEGQHESPSITIYSPVSVWLDVASHKLNGVWALLTGKYRISGPLRYLTSFEKVFGKLWLDSEDLPGVDDIIRDFEIPSRRKWKKPDSVLVLNGSPRKKEGYTYFYLHHFIKGMEDAGVKVEVIDIYDEKLSIEPCQGGFTCWVKTEGKCHLSDSANEIIEKVQSSYLTLYAFPLYINSIPSKLKALIDRMFVIRKPVFVPYQDVTRNPLWDVKERYSAIFSVCGFPDIKYFKPVVDVFENTGISFHQPLIASVLRPGVEFLLTAPPYRNYLNEILKSLEVAGRELVEKGHISKKVLDAVASDCNVPMKIWRTYANLYYSFKQIDEKMDKNKR